MALNKEFDKTLEYGESFEKKAVKDIKRLLGEDLVRSIQKINYEDNPQKQHDGIDIEMELKGWPVIIRIQVKSRTRPDHDFAFAVEKHDGEWELKPTYSEWYMYYLADIPSPYIFHYIALLLIFNSHYDELEKTIRRSNEGSEDCFFISPEQFKKWHVEVGRGKASMTSFLPLHCQVQSHQRKQ